jgi:hypothetical protein
VFWTRIKQMQQNNVPVFVTVAAATKGGLVVQYQHLEGFIPNSHLGQVSAHTRRVCVSLFRACARARACQRGATTCCLWQLSLAAMLRPATCV